MKTAFCPADVLLTSGGRIFALALTLFLCARPEPAAASPASSPNIIFIMADDLGYGDLGSYGQTEIQTPNLDTLASEGTRFTQVYAGATVCAPSRCSLMTGLTTGHCTVRGNFGVSGRVPLNDEDVTIAEVLKQAGYTTGIIGKWGLGEPGTTGIPNQQGFDYFFGYLNQARAHNYYPDYVWENQTQVWYNGTTYIHDEFTAKALDFITDNQANPFFLYLAYTIPHAAIDVPSDAPYTGETWPQVEKDFAAMVTRMDTDIGDIMALLQQLGLDNNTLVIFTSDNGPHSEGGHSASFFDSNGPLRGIKRDLYDGGIRVPTIARWPGQVPAGAVSDQVWAFWDVLPTAAELAGVTPPAGIDGISMVDALLGQPQTDHDYLYWEFHEGFAQAAVLDHWKGVRKGLGEPIELYDLATDIGETSNVAGLHPLVVSEIHEILANARTDSAEWPLPVGCGAGQVLEHVTLQSYAGTAPECAALTLALAGQRVCTDRPWTLTAIPPAYENTVLVQHADDDRAYAGSDLLALLLSDTEVFDATVAVAYRADATSLPGWLDTWTPTGETFTATGFPSGDVDFSVYFRLFADGDTVTLGGNHAGGGDAASTYFACVTKVVKPIIVTSTDIIERDVYLGDGLAGDTFTITNGGAEFLDYNLDVDADWLAVSPESGTATIEEDPIEVSYSVESLPFGTHEATITITSTTASNSPYEVTVRVNVGTVLPDFDGDTDVDLEDFGHFQACMSGTGVTQSDPDCLNARLDEDDDVDYSDFLIFESCLSGANVPAERTCDD